MNRRVSWGLALVVWALLSSGCSSTPTSVLLHIRVAGSVGPLDELRLTVFNASGVALDKRRLPASGAPALPADVVLFPAEQSGTLRLLLRGLKGTTTTGEGAGVVTLVPEEQVEATILLEAGARPDSDGDGVPDSVDNCPSIPNPIQGPCPGADAGLDGPRPDAPLLDGRADGPLPDGPLPPDQAPDMPQVDCTKHSDCVDTNPCTVTEQCVAGKCKYTLKSCSQPANPCRKAVCDPASGCKTVNKNNGTPCNDGKYCTVNDACAAGSCKGAARDCASTAPVCTSGACNEAQKGCVFTGLPDGTACDDKQPCTQAEACKGKVCVAPTAPLLELVKATDISWGTDRTVVVDSKGKVHTVYYGVMTKRLYHATNASGSWVAKAVEAPASGDLGSYPALAIDAADTLHVLYQSYSAGQMRYAKRATGASSWTAATLGPGQGHSSIAVDSKGRLHISYMRNQALWYGTNGGGSWQQAQVETATASATVDRAGIHTSLALDSADKAQISHAWGEPIGANQLYTEKLRHSTNASGSWISVDAASSLSVPHGEHSSIGVDKSGVILISHYTSTGQTPAGGFHLSTRAPSSKAWTSVTLGTGPLGSFSSLLISDKAQKTYIACRFYGSGELRLYTNASGSWQHQVLESAGQSGRWASIAQAASGRLHIVHENDSAHIVRHVALSACP